MTKRSIAKRDARADAKSLEKLLHAAPPHGYQDWLRFFFGRPCDDPWELDWEYPANHHEVGALITCTFVKCGRDMAPFSDKAIAFGLKAMLDGYHSNVWRALASADIDPLQQRAAIHSLKWLYSDCFAVRSPPVLGHLSESAGNPLEYITYMLWDVSPLDCLIGAREPIGGHSTLVQTLGEVLRLKPANPACIESVLHGFGHMMLSHETYRSEIHAAIDSFLNDCDIGRPELVGYAESAKAGYVQ